MIALAESAEPMLEDLSLDDALDMRQNLMDFIDDRNAKIMEAKKTLADLNTIIALRMEQTGSRKFSLARFRGAWVPKTASGGAKVPEPAACKAELAMLSEIPKSDLEEALPLVDVEPVVKAYLKPLRKLAGYSARAASIIERYIKEAEKTEELVIEPIVEQINVTGSARGVLA